jgi:hypothetical protein
MSATNSILAAALIAIESGGNDYARGSSGEVGALQVTAAVVSDVNRAFGARHRLSRMTNRVEAVQILNRYLAIYATPTRIGRQVTDEDRARIWNGGPDGWRMKSTLPYLRRFREQIGGGR